MKQALPHGRASDTFRFDLMLLFRALPGQAPEKLSLRVKASLPFDKSSARVFPDASLSPPDQRAACEQFQFALPDEVSGRRPILSQPIAR